MRRKSRRISFFYVLRDGSGSAAVMLEKLKMGRIRRGDEE